MDDKTYHFSIDLQFKFHLILP